MTQLTSRNKDSSLPKFVDHSNIDSAPPIFQFRRFFRSIFHLLIRRVTNDLTELDVTSIRSLVSQKGSDCILARSNFINIVQASTSNSEVEQPWYLCIPNHRSLWEYFFSTITSY